MVFTVNLDSRYFVYTDVGFHLNFDSQQFSSTWYTQNGCRGPTIIRIAKSDKKYAYDKKKYSKLLKRDALN